MSTRLVQTNQVRRAVALRLALAEIAAAVGDAPVHLLEVGSSAGLLLRHGHYGYRLGDRTAGDPASPVQLTTQWRSVQQPPDLDVVPSIASTTGVDLHPLDPAVEADRRWLEALVWPEDRDKAALLHDALELAARVPVDVIGADAVDAVPAWSGRLPRGEVRVVFPSATMPPLRPRACRPVRRGGAGHVVAVACRGRRQVMATAALEATVDRGNACQVGEAANA